MRRHSSVYCRSVPEMKSVLLRNKERFMKRFISVLILIVLWPLAASRAQVLAPNEAGVSMGDWHTIVRDVEAAKKFWILMGG
jgi:hypothetical protein